MANKIILKKSSVAAKAPVAGDLDFGELAINYTDSKLYFKKADGSIDAFTTAAASAPVTSVGGNIGAVTDAQLLASIKNVDGTGSGLDADFLDGLHASSFYLASNPNGYTSNTGTVTSVGATAPLVSSGGNTPSISIPAANSTTNGYMSAAYAAKLDGIAAGATNVTNNNQIANGAGYTTNTGTVTSVSGTGSVSGLSLSGTVTTSGSLTLSGTLSASIDNITDEARLFNNMGQNHSTQTDFNAISDFGARFVQGGTNGPTGVGANQFYGFTLGLGNDYGLASHASQLYWPRAAQNADTYIYVRDREGGTWGSWRKTKAGYADSAGSASSVSSTTSTGIQSSFVTTINTTTPGLTTYGIAFSGSSAADNAQGITWGWSGTGAQAGVYVQSSGAYGTKMYLATTDSFATGAKTAISIDHNGVVQVPRNYLQSDSSLRTPIFYDSQNTGYYLDPNSTSNLYDLQLTGGKHTYLYINPGNGHEAMVRYNGGSGSGWYVGKRISSSLVGTESFHFYSEAAGATVGGVDTGGNMFASGSHRAPIFYDTDNTGYYLNPNSSSNLRGTLYVNGGHGDTQIRLTAIGGELGSGATSAMTWWVSEPGITWNEGGFGYNVTNDGGSPSGFSRLNTSYGQSYIRFTIGGNMQFYCTNTSGTRYDMLQLNSGNYIYAYNYLEAGSSLRAPIFYDSNNTGYYADLNNTTYLYYLQSATTVRADSDRRLKENITPITSALSLVRQLQGCRYTRNDLADKTKVYIGMIAQDVLPIVPEVVSGSEAGKYSLGYAELVPVLNEAVKELDEIVSKQAAIIAKLEERLSKLLDD